VEKTTAQYAEGQGQKVVEAMVTKKTTTILEGKATQDRRRGKRNKGKKKKQVNLKGKGNT